MQLRSVRVLLIFCLLPACVQVRADGITIDKVYHPYVQLLEKEFEYRLLYMQDSEDGVDTMARHKLGYGQALSDRLFAEIYLSGLDEPGGSMDVDSYEMEIKWQLTEQGEFNNDWGLLFELENETDEDIWEASTTLIVLHEWSDWIATGNLSVIYEWRKGSNNEWETAFAGQLRYRNSERLEPGIEVYQSQDTQGIGPVMTGLWRFGGGKKLMWEIGAILGTDNETPDVSWKFNLEYEFQ